MRKTAAALALFLALAPSLGAAVMPSDPDIGLLGEGEQIVSQALGSEFSLEWMDAYVCPDSAKLFSALNSAWLLENLPLSNVIMTEKSPDGLIDAKDTVSGVLLSVGICPCHGLLSALKVQAT